MKTYGKFAYLQESNSVKGKCFELFIGTDEDARQALSKGHFGSIQEAKRYAFKQGVSTHRFKTTKPMKLQEIENVALLIHFKP